jgi:hypothetical protein
MTGFVQLALSKVRMSTTHDMENTTLPSLHGLVCPLFSDTIEIRAGDCLL